MAMSYLQLMTQYRKLARWCLCLDFMVLWTLQGPESTLLCPQHHPSTTSTDHFLYCNQPCPHYFSPSLAVLCWPELYPFLSEPGDSFSSPTWVIIHLLQEVVHNRFHQVAPCLNYLPNILFSKCTILTCVHC